MEILVAVAQAVVHVNCFCLESRLFNSQFLEQGTGRRVAPDASV